jgi:hypothetical protein
LPEEISVRSIADAAKASLWHRVERAKELLAVQGSACRRLGKKIDGIVARATGYPTYCWREVNDWTAAIGRELSRNRPEFVLVRGGGSSFEPYFAMLDQKTPVPWIAYYHDPFPPSCYPEPYREPQPGVVVARQQALHRRIVRSATALVFPSRRLLEWVLQGDLQRHQEKAFVLPHIATDVGVMSRSVDIPELRDCSAEDFTLIHTGTLIAKRSVEPLLAGFMGFLAESPVERRCAKLVLVGGIHRSHAESSTWKKALTHPNVLIVDRRINYGDALTITRRATAAVILEADGPHSPFLPGKVADYMWLRKPVIALTPRESALSDLLGSDYPLLVPPGDRDHVLRTLRRAWESWRNGQFQKFSPPASAVRSISAETARVRFDELAEWVVCRAANSHGFVPRPDRSRRPLAPTREQAVPLEQGSEKPFWNRRA